VPAEPQLLLARSEQLGRTFGALSDPARLAVIALLRKEPLRSGEIARQLALSRPLMSKHLRVLRAAGLVEESAAEPDARARVYQLRAAPFSELRSWLDEVEEFWNAQLSAFKAHVEQRAGRPRTKKAKVRR
jgi:DNA-binding transcriptional ArsR family regulator